MAVASGVPSTALISAIRQNEDLTCHCWRQFDLPPNIAATAWVLRAFALARIHPGDAEIDFLLRQQQRESGWPLYEDTRDQSTFATALAVLALADLANSGTLSAPMLVRVNRAQGAGVVFLRSTATGARWRYYPNRADSATSDADSGLVLYTLNYVKAHEIGVDGRWLDALPSSNLSPRDEELSDTRWLRRTDDKATPLADTLRHLRLPWVLAGTVSAYHEGTLRQRIRAAIFVEQTLQNCATTTIVATESFKRAELLIALRFVRSHR